MEYLRIDVSPEMDIDGVSRIQWELSESDKCDLSQTIPFLLLSGAYMFETADADHIQNKTQLLLHRRLNNNGSFFIKD